MFLDLKDKSLNKIIFFFGAKKKKFKEQKKNKVSVLVAESTYITALPKDAAVSLSKNS